MYMICFLIAIWNSPSASWRIILVCMEILPHGSFHLFIICLLLPGLPDTGSEIVILVFIGSVPNARDGSIHFRSD
jgi:hypothetical protein